MKKCGSESKVEKLEDERKAAEIVFGVNFSEWGTEYPLPFPPPMSDSQKSRISYWISYTQCLQILL